MIFESLYESSENRELILLDGGYCRFHIRKDKQLTIYEILVLPDNRNQGIGKKILDQLKKYPVRTIFAKCPTELDSNSWYSYMGFKNIGTEILNSGKMLNLWELTLN